MNNVTNQSKSTRERLIEHCRAYPALQAEDIFKYIFQSAHGPEHMISDEIAALDYIKREYASISKSVPPLTEALDGAYSRVHLSHLNGTLTPETLAKLFCLSAKKEASDKTALEQKIQVAAELVDTGSLPLDRHDFERKLALWQTQGCPALHHSDAFRATYRPAYRVIASDYVPYLALLATIDHALAQGPLTLAIEGGSASGKSTLGDLLATLYGCTVFHMDDFFLRPEQRTPERLAELGGNVDRERFLSEVLAPLQAGGPVTYCPFDCSTGTLAPPVTVTPSRLTVIEGAYSMHPDLAPHYDLSVFLDVTPDLQKKRIQTRNTPDMAERFFNEWIPLEHRYFEGLNVKARCDMVIEIKE